MVFGMKITTAIGLAEYAYHKHLEKVRDSNVAKRLSEKVVDIFNNYF